MNVWICIERCLQSPIALFLLYSHLLWFTGALTSSQLYFVHYLVARHCYTGCVVLH